MRTQDSFRIEEPDDPRTWIKGPDGDDEIDGAIPEIESKSKIDLDRYYACLIDMVKQIQTICRIEDATADRNQRYPWIVSYLWHNYRGSRELARADLASRVAKLERDIAIFRNTYAEYVWGTGLTMAWLRQNRFKKTIKFLLSRRKQGVIYIVNL